MRRAQVVRTLVLAAAVATVSMTCTVEIVSQTCAHLLEQAGPDGGLSCCQHPKGASDIIANMITDAT